MSIGGESEDAVRCCRTSFGSKHVLGQGTRRIDKHLPLSLRINVEHGSRRGRVCVTQAPPLLWRFPFGQSSDRQLITMKASQSGCNGCPGRSSPPRYTEWRPCSILSLSGGGIAPARSSILTDVPRTKCRNERMGVNGSASRWDLLPVSISGSP